jgi:hypothetical protein
VSLGLRVLSVDDLGFQHKGGSLFMVICKTKSSWRRIAAGSFAPSASGHP